MAVSTRLLVLSSVRQSRRQWVNVRCASPLLVWHRVKKLQSEVWFQQNWIISYLSLLLYTQLSSKLAGRETSSSVIHLGLPEQRTEEAAWSTQFHMARQTKQLTLIKKGKKKKLVRKYSEPLKEAVCGIHMQPPGAPPQQTWVRLAPQVYCVNPSFPPHSSFISAVSIGN